MDKIIEAKNVFNIEIGALEATRDGLNDTFVQILDEITNCSGKVIITGIGKPGHVGTKIAATLASLGTSSFFLHPAEAMHGDLGMISANDIVIAISYSGESDEIIGIIPNIKLIGAKLIGITGNAESTLARACDIVQVFPHFKEACYLGLAPTSSTTAELVYGDALAVVASVIYGFNDKQYGRLHPAGSLGKKLILTVDDLMLSYDDSPTISKEKKLVDATLEMSKSVPGIVAVINQNDTLEGVITDGDLRRLLQKKSDIYTLSVDDVMTRTPFIVGSGSSAFDALNEMKKRNINNAPVVNNGRFVGIIGVQLILKAGIVGDA